MLTQQWRVREFCTSPAAQTADIEGRALVRAIQVSDNNPFYEAMTVDRTNVLSGDAKFVAVAVMAGLFWAAAGHAGVYSGGDGTADNPYQVSTIADWQELAATPDDYSKHFILTNDLDFSGIAMTPIAAGASSAGLYQGVPFAGVFDGQGYSIRNAVIDLPAFSFVGLFSCVDTDGLIQNLNIQNIRIVGNHYVGGLAGFNSGRIDACRVTGSAAGNMFVGGLVGSDAFGTVTRCCSLASVQGSFSVGGLIGYAASDSIVNSYARGAVGGAMFVGGLIGMNENAAVAACCATGQTTGQFHTGGLCGYVITGGNYADSANFWDMQATGLRTSRMGKGRTTAQMKTRRTFLDAGWDFIDETVNGTINIWRLQIEGADYPHLSWQPIVAVPSVAGLAQPQAQAALQNSALTVGTVKLTHSPNIPEGVVILQSPAAGALVETDAAVALTISSGIVAPMLSAARFTVAAGKTRGQDRIGFTGLLNATETDLLLTDKITVKIPLDYQPEPKVIEWVFPIDATTFKNGVYNYSRKVNAAMQSLRLDTRSGKLQFAAQNADLTGLACPFTAVVAIGAFEAALQVQEAAVNGTKLCPPQLLWGVYDSLALSRYQFKPGKQYGADTFTAQGIFTVSKPLNTDEPFAVTLGGQTFTIEGQRFIAKNGVYSCTIAPAVEGKAVMAVRLDTAKCTFQISIQSAVVEESGAVDLNFNIFGSALTGSEKINL